MSLSSQLLDALKQTSLGPEVLKNYQAQKEAEETREEGLRLLAEARGLRADLPALRKERDRAEKKVETTAQKLAAERRDLSAAQRSLTQAAEAAARVQRRAEALLRTTAPHVVAENGPVLAWLQAHLEHTRAHSSSELPRWRETLRDFERAGRPEQDREAMERLEKDLAMAEAALEIVPAFKNAIDAVRDLQLSESDDPRPAVEEILKTHLPSECACGRPYVVAEALPDEPALLRA